MLETKDGQLWFDLTNIFTQEDNGEYTLLSGWNENKNLVIWLRVPTWPRFAAWRGLWLWIHKAIKGKKKIKTFRLILAFSRLLQKSAWSGL
jgi:hypothetical protein